MSNRLTFEFAVKVRKSTIRELQASRREQLVQLAHKTYEPAREKALPGPGVPFWEGWSDVFQAQVVIHRVPQFLFASEIVLGRLNGCMAKQELNLFKLSPRQVAESCAGTP